MTTRADDADFLGLISGAREEQCEAIRSTGRLTVVSAGAGTGKTDTLARRFAWLLLTDPTCKVDRILTLTFTQFAAGEMRERIRSTLKSWRALLPEKTVHLADAIERIDEAYISTIHSFALRVIRESGIDLDVDPDAALVGEPVEREFWSEFEWNLRTENRERLLAPLSKEGRENALALLDDSLFHKFLNHFGAETITKLGKSAGETFGSMNLSPGYLVNFDESREREVVDRISADMAHVCSDVWDQWHFDVLPSASECIQRSKSGAFVDKMRDFCAAWQSVERAPDAEREFFIGLMNGPLGRLPGTGELKKVISDALGMPLKDWRDSYARAAGLIASISSVPCYGEDERRVRKMLLRAAALGWESWDAARSASGLLSFDDLIRLAGGVLSGNAPYAARFRHVMIDEFQDTDGIQNDMVEALASAWNDDELRTVFIVGDIKQSIYRFRHANPMLFARRIDAAKNGAGALHIPMAHSYRMRGDLMESINRVFKSVWPDGVVRKGGVRVDYESLMPPTDADWWSVRSSVESSSLPLEIMLQVPDPEEESRDSSNERRKKLAFGIAKRLSEIVASGGPVWDKKEKTYRPASWGEVTVLVPTRTSYSAIEDAFDTMNVPVVFGRSMQYYGRGEVQDMINLLRLLDMPDDDFAAAAWAESPFSGIPPESCAALLEREDGASIYETISEAYPRECERLLLMRKKARLVSPSSAVMSLLEDDAWLCAYPHGSRPRVLANIRRGVDVLREYEASFGRSLHAEADYLGRSMRGGGTAEEPDVAGDDVDAVRVMTIHASKGLEFPIVVIMGMEAAVGSKRRERAFVSHSLGVVAGKIPEISGENPSGALADSVTARWHSYIEAGEEREESQRLMYVAMTRARDKLICAGLAKDENGTGKGDNWLDWLLEANSQNGVRFPVCFVSNDAIPMPVNRSAGPINANEARICDAAFSSPRLARISATAFSMFSWCPVAYRMRYRQGIELKWELPDGDGYGGADLGSLAHWVMQRWDMRAETLADYLPDAADKHAIASVGRMVPPYLRAVFAKGSERKILRSWLEVFTRTDTCDRLAALKEAGELKQETAFHVSLGDSALVGSIDVYWEDSDGAHIRDWKITAESRAPDELYERQLDFYALAYRIANPTTPVDVGLVYLRIPDLSSDDAPIRHFHDTDGVADSVRSMAERAVSGPFTPKTDRCCVCPFARSCPAIVDIRHGC